MRRFSRAALKRLLSPRGPHALRPRPVLNPAEPPRGGERDSCHKGGLLLAASWQQLSGATLQSGKRVLGKGAVGEAVGVRKEIPQSIARRHVSTSPKESEQFDPLQKSAPPLPGRSPSQPLHGNSFVFVAAQRESVVLRTWKRVVAAAGVLARVPVVPLALGLGGAIPFVALAPPVSAYAPLPDALRGRELEAQAAYAVCILSFLGGPHWGLAMASHAASPGHAVSNFTLSTARYAWSVVPSLLAWPALLLPPVQKFALLISSFGLALGVDAAFAMNKFVPKWYLPLRVLLTSVAVASMTSSLSVAATKPHGFSKPPTEREGKKR